MDSLANVLPDFLKISALESRNLILVLGLIMFLGAIGGWLFKKLRIPQVVGYIVIGIVIGASGFQILSPAVILSLNPVSSIALSLIGFMIGGELKLSTIKKYGKQFTGILLFESIVPFFIVSIFVTLVSWVFMKDFAVALSMGLVLGAISSATAPAATTDVLKENRTRGPLTTTVLGIVALDDAVALFLYAITSSVAGSLLGNQTASLGMQLLGLLYDIFGSIILGGVCGFVLSLIVRNILSDEGRILAFTLGAILLSTGVCDFLQLDNILAAMSLGFFMVNIAPVKSKSTFATVDKFTPPIYVLFFVLVGAKLNIWVVTPFVALIALLYVVCRTLGKSIGAILGSVITKAPVTVRKYLPFCLLSQAGVAIGLSIVAGQDFSSNIGPTIVLVITATTFIVQLVGPVCVKHGVTKAGECGLDITEEDVIKNFTVEDVTWGQEKVCSLNSRSVLIDTYPLDKILALFSKGYNQNFVVADGDGKYEGLITLDSIKEVLSVSEITDFLVAFDVMVRAPVLCSPETPVEEILGMFSEYDTEVVVIVNMEGKAMGVVERHVVDHFIHTKMAELHQRENSLDK